MSFRRTTAILAQLALITTFVVAHPEVEANGGRNLIKTDESGEWLTYLSSDELEGRRTFSEGLGLAAAYIAAQLKSWGEYGRVGTRGPTFNGFGFWGSRVTIIPPSPSAPKGQSSNFQNGDGVLFARNVGRNGA